MTTTPWPTQPWPNTNIAVGPNAWDAAVFQTPIGLEITAQPSLICVRYCADLAWYAALSAQLPPNWPIALFIAEPAFTRTFTPAVLERMAALKRAHVELLVLNVVDPADYKAGGIARQMQLLREEKKISHVGLHHNDVNQIEWMASHTNARVLAFPYRLSNQLARYRATDKAAEYGMCCLGIDSPLADTPPAPVSTLDYAFRLGESPRVLPVIAQPIDGVPPMPEAQTNAVWEAYKQSNPEPAKLPRSLPPD